MALVPDALASAIRSLAIRRFEDLIHLAPFVLNNGGGPKIFGDFEPIPVVVHDKDLACTLYDRGESRHEADRTRTVDHNGVTGRETSQSCGVPARRKDIREHDVVAFLLLGIFRK